MMQKPTTLLKICIITGFLSLLLLDVGSVRCASPPGGAGNFQPQAKRIVPAPGTTTDQNWLEDQNDKNERFQVLEWLIKQKLLMQYQKMEVREDLEDLAD